MKPTPRQIARILAKQPLWSAEEIAAAFAVSQKALRQRANRLGVKPEKTIGRVKLWSSKQAAMLLPSDSYWDRWPVR